MGIMTRIADFLASEPRAQRAMLEQRATAGMGLIPYTVGKAQYLPRDVRTYDSEAYRKVALIFRCVQYVADAAATAPLRVYQSIDGELEAFDEHPLRMLIQRPNAQMGEARFMAFITMVMSVSGFCVIEKERNRLGDVIGLWPLRSDWIRPIPRQNAPPDWEYRIPGEQNPRILSSDDVIPITYADTPDNAYTGIGPLELLLRETSTVNALTDFVKRFFDSGAIPMYGLIPSDDPKVAAQFEKPNAVAAWKAAFKQQYTGLRNAAEPMPLIGIKDIRRIGLDFNELAYQELNDMQDTRICTAFGIPPILMGAQVGLAHATYSNYGQARRSFYEDTMSPLWARLDDAFSRELVNDRDFAADISLQFDTDDIPALREDQDAATVRAVSAFTSGLVSRSNAQRIMGIDVHGDDVFLLPFSALVVPADGAQPLPRPTAQISAGVDDEQDDDERGIRILTATVGDTSFITRDGHTYLNERAQSPEQRAATGRMVAAQRATIGKLADVLEPQVATYFDAQKQRLVDAVTSARAVTVGGNGTQPVEKRAIESFDWQAEAEELRRILEQWMTEVEAQAMAQTAAMIGGGFSWGSVTNPLLASLFNSLGYRIRLITEETRSSIEQVIRKSLLEGTSMPELAGKIESLFEQSYNGRAAAVARTESMVGYGRATALAYRQSGVVSHAMIADNSEHTESYKGAADGLTCSRRNGLVVPIDRISFHIESDHPNGSACAIAIVDSLPAPAA